MRQTCSCPCGTSRFVIDGRALARFFCHCTICQSVYKQPYADVVALPSGAVLLPSDTHVKFKHYKSLLPLKRGTCPSCGAPAVAFMSLGPLKALAFVNQKNFEKPAELPEPSHHIFYHRRVTDIDDHLLKVSGYWPSEITVLKAIFAELFLHKRGVAR